MNISKVVKITIYVSTRLFDYPSKNDIFCISLTVKNQNRNKINNIIK